MLDTFTIEPERRFIIPRAAARHVWNVPLRFVSITMRQSSSDIRAINPSRVTPALLTRMSSSPTASTNAFACSGSETSASTARAPDSLATSSASSFPERYTSGQSAPARASSRAIARPIPREPPVTRAAFPSSDANASARGERLLELVDLLGSRDGHGFHVAVDSLDKAGENVARADLDERVHALHHQRLRRLGEANRRRQLLDQKRPHPLGRFDTSGHRGHERRRRLGELDAIERRAQPVG